VRKTEIGLDSDFKNRTVQKFDIHPDSFPTGITFNLPSIKTRGQNNLTKSASRGAHSPVRGHPRGSKFVPLNSWGRVSY